MNLQCEQNLDTKIIEFSFNRFLFYQAAKHFKGENADQQETVGPSTFSSSSFVSYDNNDKNSLFV